MIKKNLPQGQSLGTVSQHAVSRQREARGLKAYHDGVNAEEAACQILHAAGWRILLRRARTPRGEIDIVAQKETTISFIEVKKRRSSQSAAFSLSAKQSLRLFGAAECLLQHYGDWAYESLRFDLITLDDAGKHTWITDIIRQM